MPYCPVLLVWGLCPLLWEASLGHLPPRRIVLWEGCAVLPVAALGVYDSWRSVNPDSRNREFGPSHLLAIYLAKCAATIPVTASTPAVWNMMTPDTCFIPVLPDALMESTVRTAPSIAATLAKSTKRDSVVISSGACLSS